MQKRICAVSTVLILAGCAGAQSTGQSGKQEKVAAQVMSAPAGYLDIRTYSRDQLGMYAASAWVKQANTNDERFSRGMRVFADLRQDYYERLKAGLSASETRNLLAAKVNERVLKEYLPAGTQGLAVVFRDDSYPVNITNYSDSSGRIELRVDGNTRDFRIPDADVVLQASTSRTRSMGQNLPAISDGMKFEGQKVYGSVGIKTPSMPVSYAIMKEQFSNTLYENRKKGFETALRTSGYVLFKLARCDRDNIFDDLRCSFEPVSTHVESTALVAQRISR